MFDELQLGTGFVSRQFAYYAGEVTEEHAENGKLKSTPTTQLVSQIVLSGGRTISYEYDAEERITKVTDFADGVTEYSYDALGNPLTYLGHELTWEKGRQLKSFDSNTYTYNANGIRTSKTVAGVKHDYLLDGTKILREAWNYDETSKTYQDVLIPLYDNEDSVCGIIYNNVPYYFLKNLQGDVIAITNENGVVISRYSYDAWGANTGIITCAEPTDSVDIANINPFRYRSYYFDKEIEMYYLLSRYYDPVVGRFLNCDMPELLSLSIYLDQTAGINLFPYCLNYPVTDSDMLGCMSAQQAAAMLSPAAIFGMFVAVLLANYPQALLAVAGYVTKVIAPPVVKSFCWKPWLAAGIIAAAVSITITTIVIIYSSRKDEIDKAKRKIPNKLMKGGKVDLSLFTNPNGPKGPKGGRGILGPLGWYILKDIDQHRGSVWKLFNKIGERIASLMADGTIVGK